MKINASPEKIDELLSRSITEILPSKEEFRKFLLSGKKIKIYIGVDATGSALHLGHATNFMVLERFRRLGHKIVILIGDFTARIGDPTDRTAARIQLTRQEVVRNTKNWFKQIKPLIDFNDKNNPLEAVYNHQWLSCLTFEDVINLASNFTVQQMLERDMFEKRLNEGKPIFIHEFMYPLMQGYDSVALDVDAELCGTDQTFNALAGRTLLKKIKNKEKFVVITTLLENPVTKEKMMSKSKGTGVYLNETPENMYGKIMAQPDENIIQLFVDCTYVPLAEIEQIKKDLKNNNINPRDLKMRLAKNITEIYHGEKKAIAAEEDFVKVFQKKEIPEKILEYRAGDRKIGIVDLLIQTKLCSSKNEARRLIVQKGIFIDGVTADDVNKIVEVPRGGLIIKKGKRYFVKVIV